MKRFVFLIIAVAVVVVLWTGAWFFAAGEATKYVKSFAEADGVTTPKVTCDSFSLGGYPFGFDLTCTGATVVSGDITVTVKGLKATALVYRPTHVLIFAEAPLSIADAFTGSQRRLDFSDLEASARLEGWRVGRVSLVADKLKWNDTLVGDRLLGSASHLEAHLIDIPEQHDAAKHLAALAAYSKLDDVAAPGFDISNGVTSFEAELNGLPDDVRSYGDPGLLQRIQKAGGIFKLVGLKGEDADSRFDASGTLGLDQSGRIEGQLKLSSKGIVERLDGLIPENLKGLMLGGQAADGSYAQTINIRAGIVFSGLVPTAVIPPLY